MSLDANPESTEPEVDDIFRQVREGWEVLRNDNTPVGPSYHACVTAPAAAEERIRRTQQREDGIAMQGLRNM